MKRAPDITLLYDPVIMVPFFSSFSPPAKEGIRCIKLIFTKVYIFVMEYNSFTRRCQWVNNGVVYLLLNSIKSTILQESSFQARYINVVD